MTSRDRSDTITQSNNIIRRAMSDAENQRQKRTALVVKKCHLSSSPGHRQESGAIFRMASHNKKCNASFSQEICARDTTWSSSFFEAAGCICGLVRVLAGRSVADSRAAERR
jgi:hypothetical protein